MSSVTKWAVIECAGMACGEKVVMTFGTRREADAWFTRQYDDADRERLSPDVAHWDEDGGFWSYDH